ncbi:PilZ domain-containing protein, partial [Calditrichota bacterium]
MADKQERRALNRFNVPGSMVLYKKDEGMKIFQRYSVMSEIKDLSKSGVGLQIKNGIKKGERLQLQIVLPGEEKIDVKGRVRWKIPEDNKYNNIGIQFEPFGRG